MIHPTAIISPRAQIGADVEIGPYSVVHDNAELGPGTVIGSFCEIGHPAPSGDGTPLRIGAGGRIRSHSVFYESSSFAEGLTTGHHVVVREGTIAGPGFQVGTYGDVQGRCLIGNFVKLQSSVFIAQGSTIGSYVWLLPGVVLTNDPYPPSETVFGVTIEDYVAIAARAVILPGVTVGRAALVGANSTVTRNVAPDTVVVGSPAKFLCATADIKLREDNRQAAYPWRRRFSRGYPADLVQQWLREADEQHQ